MTNERIVRERVYTPERTVRERILTSQVDNSDPYYKLIPKALATGALSITEAPKLLELPHNLRTPDINNSSEKVKEKLKNLDPNMYDFEPSLVDKFKEYVKPKAETPTKRIAKNAAEFVGASFNPVAKTIGLLSKFAKPATAAAIGATSGIMQEGGVNPIVADIASSAAVPSIPGLVKGSFNLATSFLPKNSKALKQAKVGELLRENANVNKVLENIEAHQSNYETLPLSAEVALDPHISNIHRAVTPNMPSVAERIAENNAKYREQLSNIAEGVEGDAASLGKSGRDFYEQKVATLENKREKAAKPLYEKLEESTDLIPTENFDQYTKNAIEKELGVNEKELEHTSKLLRDKYKIDKKQISKIDSVLNKFKEDKKVYNFSDDVLPEYLASHGITNNMMIEYENFGKYTPGHIDKAITDIGTRIQKLKKVENNTNRSLIRKFTEQKNKLTEDLKLHPLGNEHRKIYAEYSKPIKEITKNKLLNKFIRKDEFDRYVTPEESLAENILSASKEDINKLMSTSKDNGLQKQIKAFVRDKYLGKSTNLENELPTYDKSSQFLNRYKDKLPEILTDQERSILENTQDLLKKRRFVQKSGNTADSPTATRAKLIKDIENKIGDEYTTGLSGYLRKTPKVGKFVPVKESKNPTWQYLEDSLLSPKTLAEYIKMEKPVSRTKKFKSDVGSFYNPMSLTHILNNID